MIFFCNSSVLELAEQLLIQICQLNDAGVEKKMHVDMKGVVCVYFKQVCV